MERRIGTLSAVSGWTRDPHRPSHGGPATRTTRMSSDRAAEAAAGAFARQGPAVPSAAAPQSGRKRAGRCAVTIDSDEPGGGGH